MYTSLLNGCAFFCSGHWLWFGSISVTCYSFACLNLGSYVGCLYIPHFCCYVIVSTHVSPGNLQLKNWSVFQLSFTEARGRTQATVKPDILPQYEHGTIWQKFRDWDVVHSSFQVDSPDMRFLQDCAFGQEFARLTVDWLCQFKWPPQDVTPLDGHCGTSWIELAVSWMCWTKRYIPLLRPDGEGNLKVLLPGCYNHAADYHMSFTEAGTMLEKLLGNVQALCPQRLMPDCKRNKTSTLYHLGDGKWYQGILQRPVLPAQKQMFDMLHDVIVGPRAGKGMTGVPFLDGVNFPLQILDQSWSTRCKKALSTMHKVRAVRKTLWFLTILTFAALFCLSRVRGQSRKPRGNKQTLSFTLLNFQHWKAGLRQEIAGLVCPAARASRKSLRLPGVLEGALYFKMTAGTSMKHITRHLEKCISSGTLKSIIILRNQNYL